MLGAKNNDKKEVLFPYYINQERLLDIYAILNGGYSEYSEITTITSDEKKRKIEPEISVSGGFKLLNLGGSIIGKINNTHSRSNNNKEKKIQTVTSMLSIVKKSLDDQGYLKNITEAKPGQFVCMPVVLSINSIKSLLSEMSELLKLSENAQKMGANVSGVRKTNNELDNILKTIRVIFEGEEILFQTNDYAIIGNIVDSNLYQAVRADIIGTELTCLALVKRVFPSGTELMKNTIFTKIKDVSAKEKLIKALTDIVDENVFDFEAIAVSSIKGKPVYQLEIIALYQ